MSRKGSQVGFVGAELMIRKDQKQGIKPDYSMAKRSDICKEKTAPNGNSEAANTK